MKEVSKSGKKYSSSDNLGFDDLIKFRFSYFWELFLWPINVFQFYWKRDLLLENIFHTHVSLSYGILVSNTCIRPIKTNHNQEKYVGPVVKVHFTYLDTITANTQWKRQVKWRDEHGSFRGDWPWWSLMQSSAIKADFHSLNKNTCMVIISYNALPL